jgi:hypothetical protein
MRLILPYRRSSSTHKLPSTTGIDFSNPLIFEAAATTGACFVRQIQEFAEEDRLELQCSRVNMEFLVKEAETHIWLPAGVTNSIGGGCVMLSGAMLDGDAEEEKGAS